MGFNILKSKRIGRYRIDSDSEGVYKIPKISNRAITDIAIDLNEIGEIDALETYPKD